jgi:acetyl esterase/lipase
MMYRNVLLLLLAAMLLNGCTLLSQRDERLVEEHASCALFKTLTEAMPNAPLYQSRFGFCSRVEEPDEKPFFTPSYYTDAACTQQLDYQPTPFFDFCKNNLLNPYNQTYIGNAAAWRDDGSDNATLGKNSKWTLGKGPSIDLLALSPKENHRPYLKQVEYREVNGCHLEMRIFRKDLQQQNLKPAMVIHGGAWQFRGFGAIGAEVLISQLTERGFIVFEPYYRLMGDSDGPPECRIPAPIDNRAPGELIIDDIEYALQWVKQHGAEIGAQPDVRISLVGQSAGAHLAEWLASHHGAEIEKALLFYPPTDFSYYIDQLGHLYPWDHKGRSLIEQFIGVSDLAPLQHNPSPFVVQNSFPELIRSGIDHPPVFMVHGNADDLVPVEMSIRLCQALEAPASDRRDLHAGGRYQCGTRRGIDNILHVVDGANHILDLKCMVDPASEMAVLLGKHLKDLKQFCPSGSKNTSNEIVRPVMEEGMNWLL